MVTLDLSDYSITCLLDLLGDRQYQPLEKETYRVELAGYGYRWFRLRGNPD
jgi:hypothetical protein